MRVLLVQPPQSDPAQPYSSLAILLAAWRRSEHTVDVLDLNLAFYWHLLNKRTIEHALARADSMLVAGVDDELQLSQLEGAISSAGWISELAPKAVAVLRDSDHFFNPDTYAWAIRTIKRALDVHSATVFPGSVGLQSFNGGHSYLSSRGILAAVQDEQRNLFLQHLEEVGRPAIEAAAPDVIAMSVTFQTQLIPAFTLARAVRRWLPGVRVVMGGATITRIRDGLQETPHLFGDVDAFVLFEGETAFLALLEEWGRERDGLQAPNVMILEGEDVRRSERIHSEDLDALPSPDHRGLPLSDYWVPRPALLLNSSRGCYYGRCKFCMISPATWGPARMGKSYRIRSTEKVLADIAHVHSQTGAVAFNLANDILPPKALREIGEGLAGGELKVTWDSEIRLEPGLRRPVLERMYEGGCRHLRFGFETASTRVAALMEKGTDIEVTERILADCRDIGITVCLLTQVAFPGETEAEADMTLDFLKHSADKVSFLSLTQFVLEEGSGVHQDPDRYEITVLPNDHDQDLSWMYHFTSATHAGSEEGITRYRRMESTLDQDYPDRDLFFKGGLGHAHTTLYTGRYGPADFLGWNRDRFRSSGGPVSNSSLVRAPAHISLHQIRPPNGSQWSQFLISSGEVPEVFARIEGSLLLVLLAASGSKTVSDVADHITWASRGSITRDQSVEFIQELFAAGLLLETESDRRVAKV